jgi:hypothetical protein
VELLFGARSNTFYASRDCHIPHVSSVQKAIDGSDPDAYGAGREPRRKTMPADATEALVLRDDRGHYYIVTPELLEQARVPDEQSADLERQFGGDVHGYSLQAGEGFPELGLPLTFTTVGFASVVQAPRDAASGQASGKRHLEPLSIVRLWNASSP